MVEPGLKNDYLPAAKKTATAKPALKPLTASATKKSTSKKTAAKILSLTGTVIAELQPGYTFRDKILRPARVVVAAALPDPPAA